MFDHTPPPDPHERRRRRSALLLAFLLLSFSLTGLLASGDSQAVTFAPDIPPDPVLVEVRAERLPPAPPAITPGAPAPSAAAAAAARPSTPPPPTPDAPVPTLDPPDLAALWKEATPASLPPEGGAGPGTGPEDGGGPSGGGGGGCPPGADCTAETLLLSGADVVARVRVRPRYPEAAKQLDLPEVRCSVHFWVDARGIPEAVEVEGCPEVFHSEVVLAAKRWRFYPSRDAQGQPQPARFTLALTFRLH